ncbi:MAG TPA: response regulator [Candidatus Hydrogenedentes bacterium]|nr:response regulator [Candidatus Hydrogenedentota bacterium]
MNSLGCIEMAEMLEDPKCIRLLIVDDEPKVRTALVSWFKLRGYRVDEACNGHEAVMTCQQKEYDIVIMDIEMPRMNGIEAIECIRKDYPDLPIIILTGFLLDTSTFPSNTVSAVLSKPLRPSELERHIRQALEPVG